MGTRSDPSARGQAAQHGVPADSPPLASLGPLVALARLATGRLSVRRTPALAMKLYLNKFWRSGYFLAGALLFLLGTGPLQERFGGPRALEGPRRSREDPPGHRPGVRARRGRRGGWPRGGGPRARQSRHTRPVRGCSAGTEATPRRDFAAARRTGGT